MRIAKNPTAISNCKKIEYLRDRYLYIYNDTFSLWNLRDYGYLWYLNDYKIIGVVENKELTIIDIAKMIKKEQKIITKELQEQYFKILDTIKQEN